MTSTTAPLASPTRHQALDRAILARVAGGDSAVVDIGSDQLGRLLREHEAQGGAYGPLLERRLTALRKAGQLVYARKGGWTLAPTPAVAGTAA